MDTIENVLWMLEAHIRIRADENHDEARIALIEVADSIKFVREALIKAKQLPEGDSTDD